MDKDKFTAVLVILIPQVIQLITEEYKTDNEKAIELLYNSELFKVLEEEETKLWHLSAYALFEMLQEEILTGKITFPEEA